MKLRPENRGELQNK